MIRLAFMPLALLALLASCAPRLSDTSGRIVNKTTGQEGRVRFIGGFQSRAVTPGSPDNVTIQLGQDLYSGTYSVIGGPNPLGVSATFGFGAGTGYIGDGYTDRYGSVRTTIDPRRDSSRPGNLIVKTRSLNSASIKTLTCSFEADASGHGVGDCSGPGGAQYALQF